MQALHRAMSHVVVPIVQFPTVATLLKTAVKATPTLQCRLDGVLLASL